MRAYIDGGGRMPTKIIAGMSDDEVKKAARINKKAVDTIQAWHANFEDQRSEGTHAKIRETAWGAFNAVTREIDHGRIRQIRGEDDDNSRRTFSNLFGRSADAKRAAWIAATEMITA